MPGNWPKRCLLLWQSFLSLTPCQSPFSCRLQGPKDGLGQTASIAPRNAGCRSCVQLSSSCAWTRASPQRLEPVGSRDRSKRTLRLREGSSACNAHVRQWIPTRYRFFAVCSDMSCPKILLSGILEPHPLEVARGVIVESRKTTSRMSMGANRSSVFPAWHSRTLIWLEEGKR